MFFIRQIWLLLNNNMLLFCVSMLLFLGRQKYLFHDILYEA